MFDPKLCQSLDDHQLVRLSLDDSNYYYCLMSRYEKQLAAYVHHLTFLSQSDIDDIIQNSFVKAYQNLNDFDFDFKFSSWIYRIVHNQSVNFLKKSKKTQTLNIDDDYSEITNWLVSDTDIEKQTQDSQFQDHIRSILAKLKPEYQQVLVLKFLQDKDYKEISHILQKPMGTVATLINRAKKQFKTIYDQNQY